MRYATIPLYIKRVYYCLVICEVCLTWVTFCALIQAVFIFYFFSITYIFFIVLILKCDFYEFLVFGDRRKRRNRNILHVCWFSVVFHRIYKIIGLESMGNHEEQLQKFQKRSGSY